MLRKETVDDEVTGGVQVHQHVADVGDVAPVTLQMFVAIQSGVQRVEEV